MSQIGVFESPSGLKETTETQEMRSESISGLHELQGIVSAVKNEIPLEQEEKSLSAFTINAKLEGDVHPNTGIPFVRKEVETDSGSVIEGVFPDFSEHTKFEITLPDDMLKKSDNTQFSYCNDKLKDDFNEEKLEASKFSERQLEQIKNGDQPQGCTWHHNEIKGVMQLVDTNIHGSTAHTGGRTIWGGGSDAR